MLSSLRSEAGYKETPSERENYELKGARAIGNR